MRTKVTFESRKYVAVVYAAGVPVRLPVVRPIRLMPTDHVLVSVAVAAGCTRPGMSRPKLEPGEREHVIVEAWMLDGWALGSYDEWGAPPPQKRATRR
jgi:hypothetical protein